MFVLLLHLIACKAVLDSRRRKETLQTTGTKLHSYHEKFHEAVLNTVEALWMDALISRQLYLNYGYLYKTLFFHSPHTLYFYIPLSTSVPVMDTFFMSWGCLLTRASAVISLYQVSCNDPWKLLEGVEDNILLCVFWLAGYLHVHVSFNVNWLKQSFMYIVWAFSTSQKN